MKKKKYNLFFSSACVYCKELHGYMGSYGHGAPCCNLDNLETDVTHLRNVKQCPNFKSKNKDQ